MKLFYLLPVLLVLIGAGYALFLNKKKTQRMQSMQGMQRMPGEMTDRTDINAPKVIQSKDIHLFDAYFVYADARRKVFHHVHAQKQADGGVELTFGFGSGKLTAAVGPEFLVSLQEIIDKHRLAGWNGVYKVTAGLPEEPTSFLCKYASGESIYFHVNSSPESEWMRDVYRLFSAEFEIVESGAEV